MTIEEAIRRIKEHIEIHSRKERYHAVLITEALNMAVNALEENQKLKADYERLQEEAKLIKSYLPSSITAMNTCICCGEIIPEGRQVCPKCENK